MLLLSWGGTRRTVNFLESPLEGEKVTVERGIDEGGSVAGKQHAGIRLELLDAEVGAVLKEGIGGDRVEDNYVISKV